MAMASGSRAGLDRDDVGDARGLPVLGPDRVDLLHPDLEAVEPQLIDEVGAGVGVGGVPDRAAADGAGEAIDVRARVVDAKQRRVPRGRSRPRSDGDERAVAKLERRAVMRSRAYISAPASAFAQPACGAVAHRARRIAAARSRGCRKTHGLTATTRLRSAAVGTNRDGTEADARDR